MDLVKSHQKGIPLLKIAVFYKGEYGRPLRKKELGFSSIADFIDSLNQELCVENGQIFYRIAKSESATAAGNDLLLMLQYNSSVIHSHVVLLCFFMLFSAPPMHVDGVFTDVVELVKDHPSGIPIRRLGLFFNQKYRRNLAVSEFGFKTVASFIDSLNDELLVEKEIIYHKNHRAAPAVPTPVNLPRVNNDSPPANPASPVVSFGADCGQRGSEMMQEELMDKVKEVIKKYPAARQSIVELQNGYFLLFGSALPLDLYMSLYDNHTSKQLSSSCRVVNNKPAGAKCLERK